MKLKNNKLDNIIRDFVDYMKFEKEYPDYVENIDSIVITIHKKPKEAMIEHIQIHDADISWVQYQRRDEEAKKWVELSYEHKHKWWRDIQ